MHDETPRSRKADEPDDGADSAFDALGLSDLFEPTTENPVVGASPDGAGRTPESTPLTRPPAFADTITSNPPTSAVFPWIAPKPGDAQRAEAARREAERAEAERAAPDAAADTTTGPAPVGDDTSPRARARAERAARADAERAEVAPPTLAAAPPAPPVVAPVPAATTRVSSGVPTSPAPVPPAPVVAASGAAEPSGDAPGTAEGRDVASVAAAVSASAVSVSAVSASTETPATTGVVSGAAHGHGGGSGGSGHGPTGGLLAAIRSHPRAWLVAAIVVAAVVLGGIAFGLGAASPASARTAPAASATPRATPTPKPTVRPTPSAAPAAAAVRTCSVDQYASDPAFGTLEAQVRNAATGQVLYDRNGSTPEPTASVLKTLTAAAALSVLGPNYRIPTTVVKGSQPGQVVIIGGGDPTLSRLPSGEQSYYANAPHLDTLAAQVKQAWAADPANAGQPITSLVVDTSLFSGPVWLPSWGNDYDERVIQADTPYITALMTDGDRADPTQMDSPRSTDPVGRAASAFAADLGGDITITDGTAPAGATQLGQVLSQPVSTLIQQALPPSDNTIMEMLARLVAIKTGAGNTFAAENAGTLKGLEAYGIPETGLYFADGSGLSDLDRVPASYLTQFMIKVYQRQDGLGIIYDGLPVAGQTGTLGPGYGRFDGSYSSQAAGHVNAKTGWITVVRSLAGVIHAKDGTNLTFAVYAVNFQGDDAAMNAIDNLTTAFYECGNQLSDY